MMERIAQVVSEKQGLKETELVVILTATDPTKEWPSLIEKAIWDGVIISVDYTLPAQSDRIKSILFPKGTNIL